LAEFAKSACFSCFGVVAAVAATSQPTNQPTTTTFNQICLHFGLVATTTTTFNQICLHFGIVQQVSLGYNSAQFVCWALPPQDYVWHSIQLLQVFYLIRTGLVSLVKVF
jgi:hypothetical protein